MQSSEGAVSAPMRERAFVNCYLFEFLLSPQLCGLGLIATGLLIKFGVTDWVPIDEIANLLNSQLLRSAVYIIIAAGGFVFLVAICGCLGALLENKCLWVLVRTLCAFTGFVEV